MSRRDKFTASKNGQGTPHALPILRLDLVIDEYERDCRRRTLEPEDHPQLPAGLRRRLRLLGGSSSVARPPSTMSPCAQAERYLDHLLERGKAPTSRR